MLGAAVDHHVREHIGLERPVRVVERQPHPQRARPGVELRVDVLHPAFPGTARIGRHRDLGAQAGLEPVDLVLEHVHQDPDLRQVGQGDDLLLGTDVHALAHAQQGHYAVGRRHHGDGVLGLAPFFDAPDGGLWHTQQAQPIARLLGTVRRLHCTVERNQEVHLGAKDLGGVESAQHLTALHRVALGTQAELFDPARGARMQVCEAGLVVGDPADGADVPPQGRALHLGGAHAHALHDLAADAHYGARGGRVRDLPRHQVHAADRAVARRVTDDLRVHGTDVPGVEVLDRMLQRGVAERLVQALGGDSGRRVAAAGQQQGQDQQRLSEAGNDDHRDTPAA